ncbi:MAG: FG-GAP-like repeat-containing protein [Blastocatellia bacterium]
MKRRVFLILCLICGVAVFISMRAAESTASDRDVSNVSFSNPVSGSPIAFSIVAGPFGKRGDLNSGRISGSMDVKELASGFPIKSLNSNPQEETDGALASFSDQPMPTPSLSFDGIANLDNAAVYGLLIIPPDMTGDVGPNHYVQAVNSLIRVYDKNGVSLTDPFRISDLFVPLGTPCATRNDGLPNVLYDPLADRWLISQICTNAPPFRQMIAISRTGDPTAGYFAYEYVMPNVKLNDFAKFGVWPDGYYMATDEFLGADYVGTGMFAFDRAKMLAGDPTAAYIYFNRPVPVQNRRGGLLPSDLDGLTTPPPGTPNIFAGYSATEYGDATDAIRLFEFRANFANPAASAFTERPESPIVVAAFDPTSPDGRPDIAQPPPGERLDSQSDRLMHRLAYRNFGTHESLVVNQTVRTTSQSEVYRAGVRVYEMRRAAAAGFTVQEQSTIGDTLSSRWIGGAAQDHQGNLAVEYNLVTDIKEPSIYYTGKLAADPQGTFRPETPLIEGTGVQKAFGWRWGEYSGMSVDPVDDCTFWVTNGYYTQESEDISDFAWLTRIGRFRFNECANAARASINGTVINANTGQPISGAVIKAGQYSRATNLSGRYGSMSVLPGSYQLSASARGFAAQSVNVTLSKAESAIRNFALTPIPVLEPAGTAVVAESCNPNGSAEPGETVSVNVTLRNTGELFAANLTATLLPGNGVNDPGPTQSFGFVPAGGSATRPFSFTVAPNFVCGAVVVMTFRLNDGGADIGTLETALPTGVRRIALSEKFDSVTAPALPAGWLTSSTPGHQLWRTSAVRVQSVPNAVFSPSTVQMGINELTSPVFPITTPNAEISFRNWYELETTFLRNRLYDGSVLEVKIDSGSWQDILGAGGIFLSGGYDGVIDSCCQNPLAGRLGWSGRSGLNSTPEFITTTAKLPASAAGQNVQIRFRIGTDIGGQREGQYIDDLLVTDGYVCSCSNVQQGGTPFDFDGDGKTDLSVFLMNDVAGQQDFRVLQSSTQTILTAAFGSVGDDPANADFDGDARTDIAVFRPANGTWYVLRSSDSTVNFANFGLAGDKVQPFDFDGDAKADLAVYRPSNGVWYSLNSSNGQFSARQFGLASDIPTAADFDGDGKDDIAVYRPATGVWYILRSQNGSFTIVQFGLNGDRPVAGDFDGDGRGDFAVFRPSDRVWYLLRSNEGFAALQFGLGDDKPLQADFDGDGKADIAVYRPSTGVFYYLRSSDGGFSATQFGLSGEGAVPGIFVEP